MDLARKEKGTVSKGEKENSLVLPAASSPNIRIRISLLPNSLPKHCAYPEDDSRGGQDARGQVERKRKEGKRTVKSSGVSMCAGIIVFDDLTRF